METKIKCETNNWFERSKNDCKAVLYSFTFTESKKTHLHRHTSMTYVFEIFCIECNFDPEMQCVGFIIWCKRI